MKRQIIFIVFLLAVGAAYVFIPPFHAFMSPSLDYLVEFLARSRLPLISDYVDEKFYVRDDPLILDDTLALFDETEMLLKEFSTSLALDVTYQEDISEWGDIQLPEYLFERSDPFSQTKFSANQVVVSDKKLEIRGIVYHQEVDKRLVIVAAEDQYETLRSGDFIGNYRLISIHEDHVVFEKTDENGKSEVILR